MSLYVAPNGISSTRLRLVTAELQTPGKIALSHAGSPGWLWVDDAPERFAPAKDPVTGVAVISSGRLVWSAEHWSRAERLPYTGGLANRLILERYLEGGVSAVTPFNGSAVIVIHDPRSGEIHVWTDQFGYHPCFIYRGDRVDQCIVTTFPDAVAADSGADLTYDLVSAAEFLRAWRATPPNTYFNEIKHVGAATHLTISVSTSQISRRAYWQPFEEDFFPNIEAAAEELAGAVRAAVSERTAIAEHPLVFVSGGADSRVLLFCATDASKLTAVNLYERATAETATARKLADAAGCRFVAFQRDSDFYPRHLVDSVRWSGAMWSTEDTHYPGFSDCIAEFCPDLIMTACTTDWVFKGYGIEKRHKMLFGRCLPLFDYLDKRVNGFLPNFPLRAPAAYEKAIHQRMADWFAGCPDRFLTPRDRLTVEDRRIRPTAYTVSVSGSIMYRRFPYDMFLADSRVAACYSRTHPDWKLNHELWGKAAARLCVRGGKIVNSNYGWRVDAGTQKKLLRFTVGWFERRLRRFAKPAATPDDHPPSSGSWPDLGWYASHSPTLAQIWTSVRPEERERMYMVFGTDPFGVPLRQWETDGNGLFRILTILCHWRETDRRRKALSAPFWSMPVVSSTMDQA